MSRLDPSDERVRAELLADVVLAGAYGRSEHELVSGVLEGLKASRAQAAIELAELTRAGLIRPVVTTTYVATPAGVAKRNER